MPFEEAGTAYWADYLINVKTLEPSVLNVLQRSPHVSQPPRRIKHFRLIHHDMPDDDVGVACFGQRAELSDDLLRAADGERRWPEAAVAALDNAPRRGFGFLIGLSHVDVAADRNGSRFPPVGCASLKVVGRLLPRFIHGD